jgi:hypothetical protein
MRRAADTCFSLGVPGQEPLSLASRYEFLSTLQMKYVPS